MLNFNNRTIREIALEAPLTIRVFENYKIDFCCGGRIPFAEACEKAGVDPAELTTKLEEVFEQSQAGPAGSAERKKAAELIDHIVRTHHDFTRSEFARLLPLADKVAVRHGDHHAELLEIQSVFQKLADEMLLHMQKEEMLLFPYIERLEVASDTNGLPPMPPFATVNNPVRMMMFEHEQSAELLRKLRSLSSDYTAPEEACPSYKGLYAGLEYLEQDLHRHIHLENNILFPQAIELEKGLFAGVACSAS
jgi:regulator of cell morphogenesis and NO signaling